jgi:hypothetical protein
MYTIPLHLPSVIVSVNSWLASGKAEQARKKPGGARRCFVVRVARLEFTG